MLPHLINIQLLPVVDDNVLVLDISVEDVPVVKEVHAYQKQLIRLFFLHVYCNKKKPQWHTHIKRPLKLKITNAFLLEILVRCSELRQSV